MHSLGVGLGELAFLDIPAVPTFRFCRDDRHTVTGHQRKSVCVKVLVGASTVVCPCIAVMGLVLPNSV